MRTQFTKALFALFLLGGCSGDDAHTGPGGVSTEDAEALGDAAAKLEQESNAPPK